MADRPIAKEDIVEVNSIGQTVVLVHKGQPIPEGVQVPQSKKKASPRGGGHKAASEK